MLYGGGKNSRRVIELLKNVPPPFPSSEITGVVRKYIEARFAI
jgi:hypothetical protein